MAPGVPVILFRASEYVDAIDSIFAVDEAEGRMVWNNNAFSDGTTRFCADPTGTLYGVFSGPLPGNCTATELRVKNRKSAKTVPWSPAFCMTFADYSSSVSDSCLLSRLAKACFSAAYVAR